MISEQIHSLTSLLKRPYFTRRLILKEIQQLGEALDQEAAVPAAIDAIRNESLVEILWKFLASESSTCDAPGSIIIITVGLNFLKDLTLSGYPIVIHSKAAAKVFGQCYEIQEIATVLSQLLVRATHTRDGLDSLEGIAQPLVGAIVRDDFGPWILAVWRFLAFWANRGNVTRVDTASACRVFYFALVHENYWKRDHSEALCQLAEGIN
jgi:hypothetical protein